MGVLNNDKTFNIKLNLDEIAKGAPDVPSILSHINPNNVHFEDYLTAKKCIILLSSNAETKNYVNNLVLFVSNDSSIDIPEQSNNKNFEIYYQKLDKENKLVVNKLIWSIRPRPKNETINQDKVLESCRAFLQAFNDAVLLDKLAQQEVITLIDTGE